MQKTLQPACTLAQMLSLQFLCQLCGFAPLARLLPANLCQRHIAPGFVPYNFRALQALAPPVCRHATHARRPSRPATVRTPMPLPYPTFPRPLHAPAPQNAPSVTPRHLCVKRHLKPTRSGTKHRPCQHPQNRKALQNRHLQIVFSLAHHLLIYRCPTRTRKRPSGVRAGGPPRGFRHANSNRRTRSKVRRARSQGRHHAAHPGSGRRHAGRCAQSHQKVGKGFGSRRRLYQSVAGCFGNQLYQSASRRQSGSGQLAALRSRSNAGSVHRGKRQGSGWRGKIRRSHLRRARHRLRAVGFGSGQHQGRSGGRGGHAQSVIGKAVSPAVWGCCKRILCSYSSLCCTRNSTMFLFTAVGYIIVAYFAYIVLAAIAHSIVEVIRSLSNRSRK